ncbi:hypothetical protein H6G04_32790 [Calothrix membranacea FACHB-236]|nr:hypothetical protein [Calothrix membranacea FACHB-236]
MSKEQDLQLTQNNTGLTALLAYELNDSELEAISGGESSSTTCIEKYRLNGQLKTKTCTTTTTK